MVGLINVARLVVVEMGLVIVGESIIGVEAVEVVATRVGSGESLVALFPGG